MQLRLDLVAFVRSVQCLSVLHRSRTVLVVCLVALVYNAVFVGRGVRWLAVYQRLVVVAAL